QWHCSPSAVMQQALAQVTMSPAPHNGGPTDTSQIRELIRAEFMAMQAAQASVTETVTETVTDTLARDLPALVRQLVEGLALEALGLPVTDTYSDVTDTQEPDLPVTDTYYGNVTDIEGPEGGMEEPEPRKVGRPRGEMR